jgi:hypothetical protein
MRAGTHAVDRLVRRAEGLACCRVQNDAAIPHAAVAGEQPDLLQRTQPPQHGRARGAEPGGKEYEARLPAVRLGKRLQQREFVDVDTVVDDQFFVAGAFPESLR